MRPLPSSPAFCAVTTASTPGGRLTYEGDARIDGVAGTAAPVLLNFLDAWGAVTGQVFFASANDFTAAFDFKEVLERVTIDGVEQARFQAVSSAP